MLGRFWAAGAAVAAGVAAEAENAVPSRHRAREAAVLEYLMVKMLIII
mgnify:CR=1 FL=1